MVRWGPPAEGLHRLGLRRHPGHLPLREADAKATYKHGFGFHPLLCFLDVTNDAVAGVLRPGNAGSNTVTDHIAVLDAALGPAAGEDEKG